MAGNLFKNAKDNSEKEVIGRKKVIKKVIKTDGLFVVAKVDADGKTKGDRKRERKAAELVEANKLKAEAEKKEAEKKAYDALDLKIADKKMIYTESNIDELLEGSLESVISNLITLRGKGETIDISQVWHGYEDEEFIATFGRKETNTEYKERKESERAEIERAMKKKADKIAAAIAKGAAEIAEMEKKIAEKKKELKQINE